MELQKDGATGRFLCVRKDSRRPTKTQKTNGAMDKAKGQKREQSLA